jgi:hypothetical protein
MSDPTMKDEARTEPSAEAKKKDAGLRSWLIILTIAILFIGYGLFMFFAVGDKGPPRWDFGVVEDIPGESVYSTHSLGAKEPEPQHVSQKPPQAMIEVGKGKK